LFFDLLGWDEHPRALSLRLIFICASITGVIVYAGYSAAIVSTLSMKQDLIQSTTALINSRFRFGVRDDFRKSDWKFEVISALFGYEGYMR